MVRMREVCPVLGPLDLERRHRARGNRATRRAPVVRPPTPPAHAEDRREASAITSKGCPRAKLRRSATSAGPSARRDARPSSVRRGQASGSPCGEKNRSASSPGSSARGAHPRAGPRRAGCAGTPARAWVARRRRWPRRPAARPGPRPPRRHPPGCAPPPPRGPAPGPSHRRHLQQVVDVAAQIHHPTGAGTLVAAPVVGQR